MLSYFVSPYEDSVARMRSRYRGRGVDAAERGSAERRRSHFGSERMRDCASFLVVFVNLRRDR
jgi:hypothetical protein